MPPCESTSSIHRRPKRSKASIFTGSITYSTTQVITPQPSDHKDRQCARYSCRSARPVVRFSWLQPSRVRRWELELGGEALGAAVASHGGRETDDWRGSIY